jgi:nicotinamidase-related amidase
MDALDPAMTALVVVDLQRFAVAWDTCPLDGRAVLRNVLEIAGASREAGAVVTLVEVGGASGRPRPDVIADQPMPTFDISAEDFAWPEELGPAADDLVVAKSRWGAFFDTDLEERLLERGITTLIIAGIATNYGVESTARQANERGFQLVIVSDATAAFTADEHTWPLEHTLARISRVRTTAEVVAALRAGSGV